MAQENINFGNDIPKQRFLPPYVLLVLQNLGGQATVHEVEKGVAKMLKVNDELLNTKTAKTDAGVFSTEVRFARQRLVWSEYLLGTDEVGKGNWALSKKGKEVIKEIYPREETVLNKFRDHVWEKSEEVRKEKHEKNKKEKQENSEKWKTFQDSESEQLELDEERTEEQEGITMLDSIKQMSPEAFERLCGRLFKEAGYEDVVVTQKSHDGGLDGFGFLVFGLVRFKVIFQAKRYTDSPIGVDAIKLLDKTKTDKKAEKSVFITTSTFTRGAVEQADNDGIELIDGDDLLLRLKEYKIGCKPTYEFDKDFFRNF